MGSFDNRPIQGTLKKRLLERTLCMGSFDNRPIKGNLKKRLFKKNLWLFLILQLHPRGWVLMLCMWKETWIFMKRDLSEGTMKETFVDLSYDTYVRSHVYVWKETYICEKRPGIENYNCQKRLGKETLWLSRIPQLRPRGWVLQTLHMWKETYVFEKRPMYVKRDLLCTYEESSIQKTR